MPKLTNGVLSIVCSPQYTKSQYVNIVNPMPTAIPLGAAMTGFEQVMMA
jgi:hypothetical protein